jgi:glutaredoxin-like protein
MAEKIEVYGTSWCSDCRRAKDLMNTYGIDYNWTNIEEDQQSQELVKKLNNGKSIVPTIVFPDGSILVEPSNIALIKKLNL